MRILNFGSLNLDNVYSVDHFTRPGETQSSEKFESFCGGKGLNQSIALAKAGASVCHAGAVGENDGQRLIDALKTAGADISFVKRTKGVSGHAIIQVDKKGQNCILLFGGANAEITKQQIDETLEHFEAGDILLLQNEISELPYLLDSGKKRRMKIYLNPSPITESLLHAPLEKVDCFILNEIEAADLCGGDVREEELPLRLREKYPDSLILLTLGEKGSIYYDGKQSIHQPAFPVQTVDTTAAGDTFTGYFIAAEAAGEQAETGLSRAAKAAAIAVSRNGASVSIPTFREVDAF